MQDNDQLVVALNELGCVYRERGHNGDWATAKKHLQESLDISQKLRNSFRQADNWADLAILHCRRAVAAAQRGAPAGGQAEAELVRTAVAASDGLAGEQGFTYLQAKNQRTLGDLAYVEGQIESAFDCYYQACRLMVQALAQGKGSAVLLRRRYEEMLDRLQERLQAQEISQRLALAETLLAKIGEPPPDEAGLVNAMQDVLQAAMTLARRLQKEKKADG